MDDYATSQCSKSIMYCTAIVSENWEEGGGGGGEHSIIYLDSCTSGLDREHHPGRFAGWHLPVQVSSLLSVVQQVHTCVWAASIRVAVLAWGFGVPTLRLLSNHTRLVNVMAHPKVCITEK